MSNLSWLNPTPHAIAVYASRPTVASGHATLATKRTLLLTWAGLSPAGSHQLAAGALTQSPASPPAARCRHRPCRRTAEQRDEPAPFHDEHGLPPRPPTIGRPRKRGGAHGGSCRTARTCPSPPVTMTSTLNRTNSTTISPARSKRPSADQSLCTSRQRRPYFWSAAQVLLIALSCVAGPCCRTPG